MSLAEVVLPQSAHLLLPADIPDAERHVGHGRDGLDVEADGGNRRHRLVELDSVQDRGLYLQETGDEKRGEERKNKS